MQDLTECIDELYEQHLRHGVEALVEAEGLSSPKAESVLRNGLLGQYDSGDSDPDVNFHYGAMLDLNVIRNRIESGQIATRGQAREHTERLLEHALNAGAEQLLVYDGVDEQVARSVLRDGGLDQYPSAMRDPVLRYNQGIVAALDSLLDVIDES